MILVKSMYAAYCGIQYVFKNELNFLIELVLAGFTIIAAIILKASPIEWLAILICIGIVLSLEILNTAIEKLCNCITIDYHPTIKIVKDAAAGAVLFFCIISVVIACIIFLPKIF